MREGAGRQRVRPSSFPQSVLRPAAEGLLEAAIEKQAPPQARGLGIRGTRVRGLMPPLVAGDWASNFLSLSLSLLIRVMGPTTLPASRCEEAASCQYEEAGGLRGLGQALPGQREAFPDMLRILTREAEMVRGGGLPTSLLRLCPRGL